jgi:MFS family permease
VFLDPFRTAGFRWAWLCILLAASGRFGLILVAGKEAFTITGSSIWSSLVMMFLLGPVILLGPFSGAMADRHKRSLLMTISLMLAIAGCLIGAAVPGAPSTRLGIVVGSSLIVGISNTLFNPAWQAIIPEILGTRRLLSAGAFTRVAGQGGEFVGPLIGTPVVLAFGIRIGFAYCAAVFLAAAAITPVLIKLEPHSARATEPVIARTVQGLRYIFDHRQVGGVMLLTGLHCCLTMAFLGLLPGLAAHHLAAPDIYGTIVTALGLGAIIGAAALATVSNRPITVPVLIGCGLASGAFQIWLGLARSVPTTLIAAFLCGVAQATFMAASYSAIQTLTHTRFRGRVASVSIMMTMGSMGVLGLGWAALATYSSESFILAALGAAFIVVILIFLATFKPLRTRHGLSPRVGPTTPTGPTEPT